MSSASRIDSARETKMARTPDRCPRCGRASMRNDSTRGEIYCSKCGFVVSDKAVETGPEWRSFSNEEKDETEQDGPPYVHRHARHGPCYDNRR